MKREKIIQILKAIKDNKQYSRNNRDIGFLQANGYIEAKGVVNTSYRTAEIKLTDYGEFIASRPN